MLLNYLKGSSASVLSSIAVMFLFMILFGSDFSLSDALYGFYSYLYIATFFGYIGGVVAIGVVSHFSDKGIFNKRLLAVFAIVGLLIGLGLEWLTDFGASPFFLIGGVVGSLAFLAVQNIQSKLIGWSIVILHFVFFFIYPLVDTHL
ncbi:hypothetical protein [Planococcus wigleyi]|uniref:Uncharacterized protein n=1 Tax=Planococcus wigleyi TaxID=2762216 RepID=A0ABR8WF96_9BACL|nr:hypothetical protein [Planococcus wigleyi]MBD8015568.1 hypothetical protein [Planococcus wigleyi]